MTMKYIIYVDMLGDGNALKIEGESKQIDALINLLHSGGFVLNPVTEAWEPPDGD